MTVAVNQLKMTTVAVNQLKMQLLSTAYLMKMTSKLIVLMALLKMDVLK